VAAPAPGVAAPLPYVIPYVAVLKTSVYLPDRLKLALAAAAARTGRSEADVIRAAVAREVDEGRPSSVTPPDPPVPGRLVGVGVGPGDPSLLTLAAVAALRRAHRVLAPATSVDAVGRAETVVRQAVPEVAIQRVPFAMAPDRAARDGALQAAAEQVIAHLDTGEEVAFVTLGDPFVYSTFAGVRRVLLCRRPNTPVVQIPGIMAFQALAARTGTVLADEEQAILVRTVLRGDGIAEDLGRRDATVVAYKGGRRLPEISAAAERAGRAGGAVAGELLGMPGERVGALAQLATGPASYLATVIIPAGTDEEDSTGRNAPPHQVPGPDQDGNR
jgi:precorrin-2/cobalt-factor-2 C20-methyltransferase